MKKSILTLFTTCLLILGSSHLFGQGVEENQEVRSFLNNMFSPLDKTKVPDGLLKDYAFELTNLDRYTGNQLTTLNYVDRDTYEMILRTIKSSAVGTQPYDDVDDILKNQYAAGGQNIVSLSALVYRYSYIKENAVTSQLINYANGQVSDKVVNGTWQNPYASAYAIGLSTQDSIFNTGSLTFKLNANCWLSNVSYQKIEIDPDGNGYRQITLGGAIPVSYGSSGKKEIKLRVTLTNGSQLLSHTAIQVSSAMAARNGNLSFCERIPAATITGAAYKGKSTTAEVYSCPRTGGIKNPLIIVEGFDPRGTGPLEKGYNNIGSFKTQLALNGNIYGSSILENYDIIYVDWVNSEEYMQANANTLKAVIQWVNQQKHAAGSTAPNVVMGQSMGGVIARYALKTMENQGLPHETSIYVSHDAPHLGANVPLGILYGLHGAISFLENKSIIGKFVTGGNNGTYIEFAERLVHSNAARQMLINYVDFGGNLNNTEHNLWQQELATLGFPQGDPGKNFRMLALANGSYSAESVAPYYLSANVSATSDLLDILPGLNGIAIGIVFQDIWAGVLGLIPGKSTVKGIIEFKPGISIGTKVTNLDLKYVKKFLWAIPVTKTIYSYEKFMNSGLTYDIFPSSQYSTGGLNASGNPTLWKPFIGQAGFNINVATAIPFIPTSSALAVGSGTQQLTASMFTSMPNSTSTPFGGNVFVNQLSSAGHIDLGTRELEWLVTQLRLGINGPKLGVTGSQYALVNPPAGSVSWSTSNSSIATINQAGVLTAIGRGVIDVIANVNNAPISTRIAVGTPRFVLANVQRDPGFYTIKAQCIDTEPGYADFILNSSDIVIYQWGVKSENDPINWFNSASPTVKLSTTKDNENTSIYLKVKDAYGNESTPIFVRITGYDIYELLLKTLIVNSSGDIYTSTGTKLIYNFATMPLVFRSTSQGQFSNAKWNPVAAIVANDENAQRGILWDRDGYIKNVIPPAEVERIKTTFGNNQVGVYTLMLLNFDKQIIQKTPFTIIYKANYPN